VDRRPGAVVAPVSQAIHPSSSSRVTLRDTNTRISVRINSNFRGSPLSSISSTARIVNQEEVSTRGRTTKHLAFLTQQLMRTIRQSQSKEEADDVSIVESKVNG
jgi:hypothetical protein